MPSTELFALEYLNSISLKVIYIKSNKNPNYLSAFRSRRGVLGVYDSLPGYLSASSYQISDLWPCFKKGKVGGGEGLLAVFILTLGVGGSKNIELLKWC